MSIFFDYDSTHVFIENLQSTGDQFVLWDVGEPSSQRRVFIKIWRSRQRVIHCADIYNICGAEFLALQDFTQSVYLSSLPSLPQARQTLAKTLEPKRARISSAAWRASGVFIWSVKGDTTKASFSKALLRNNCSSEPLNAKAFNKYLSQCQFSLLLLIAAARLSTYLTATLDSRRATWFGNSRATTSPATCSILEPANWAARTSLNALA